MDEIEKQLFNDLAMIASKEYINDLTVNNIQDFTEGLPLEYLKSLPFKCYKKFYCYLRQLIDDEHYFNNILKGALLYMTFDEKNTSEYIKGVFIEANIEEMRNIFKEEVLVGISIIKKYFLYLVLLTEDLAYKDILLDEIANSPYKDSYNSYANLDKIQSITTIDQTVKNFLIDFYNQLTNLGTPKKDIFYAIDEFFLNDSIAFDYQTQYSILFNKNTNMKKIKLKMIQIIHSEIFVFINKNGIINPKIHEYFKNISCPNSTFLPNDTKFRHHLYNLFFISALDNSYNQNLISISPKKIKKLKAINPSYFLPLFDTGSSS